MKRTVYRYGFKNGNKQKEKDNWDSIKTSPFKVLPKISATDANFDVGLFAFEDEKEIVFPLAIKKRNSPSKTRKGQNTIPLAVKRESKTVKGQKEKRKYTRKKKNCNEKNDNSEDGKESFCKNLFIAAEEESKSVDHKACSSKRKRYAIHKMIEINDPEEMFSYYKDNKKRNIFSKRVHVECDTMDRDEKQKGLFGNVSPLAKRTKLAEVELSPTQHRIDTEAPIKSPFKNYKSTVLHRKITKRRFSSLPTDVPSEDEIEEEEDQHKILTLLHETTMFGFHRPPGNPVKVPRKDKHLYTVVKNSKSASECMALGESQQYKDDIDYLLDGLNVSHTISTRYLTAFDLATKCSTPGFRMHIKAHGLVTNVFDALEDALDNELLCVCTSLIMYVLSKDRSFVQLDERNIGFLIKVLSSKRQESSTSRELTKLTGKVRNLLEKLEESFEDEEITAGMLCEKALLSLSTRRIGGWFKDAMRNLKGLDYLTDTIYTNSKCMITDPREGLSYNTVERCVKLLGDVTEYHNENRNYLMEYRDGLLLESCVRLIKGIIEVLEELSVEMKTCLFVTLKLMANLSHENGTVSAVICKQDGSFNCLLKCALHLPKHLPEKERFDFIAVSLGLMINLVEESPENVKTLSVSNSESYHYDDDSQMVSSMEAFLQFFLKTLEKCKELNLMEELLKLKNEQEENEAAFYYEDNEFELVCGDRFDGPEQPSEEKQPDKPPTSSKADFHNALEQAHEHMENTHLAAYSALLIGLLMEDHTENQQTVHHALPKGDFTLLHEPLSKILKFMRITGATNQIGLKVIERIICLFEKCANDFTSP